MSFTPLHSSAPHFRFIAPCSQLNICSSALHPAALHKSFYGRDAKSLSQARSQLTWLHYTRSSLLHFSQVQSTRCQFLCARRPPHLGCVHLASAIAHSSLISQIIAKVHLHSSATFVPCGKYTPVASYVAAIAPDDQGFTGSPFVGARRPPPLRRTSLFRRPSNGSQSLQPRQVCGAAMLLFLPQALLPAGLTHFAIASKKALLIYI